MAKLHTLQAHGSGGLVSMRNTNTAAGRAAHAPGDDPLARALKELNSRALRVGGPSGHKCAIPSLPRRGVIVRKSLDLRSSLFVDYTWYSHMGNCGGAVRGFRPNASSAQQTVTLVHTSMINITSAKPRSSKPNAKIRKWVEQALPAQYEDVTVMVNELQCFEPGCAPVETVISLLDPGKPIVFKVFFPIAEVAESPPDQVLAALQVALKGAAPAHRTDGGSSSAGEAADEAVGEACGAADEAVGEICGAADEAVGEAATDA